MKIFVTGVGGQLGHDVMNELSKRGYEGVGSDLAPAYSGIQDGSAVTKMPYVSMDITDRASVDAVLTEARPDAVVHCAAWTAVDMAEDDDKVEKVRLVNVAEALIDENGEAVKDLSADGVHFKKDGYILWLDYLTTHTGP